MVTVLIDIDEAFARAPLGDSGKLGLPVDGGVDVESFSDALMAMGRVALVLNQKGLYEYDRSVYAVHWDGALLAPVTDEGTFTFGALGEEADDFQNGLDTVAEVASQYRSPSSLTAVDSMGNRVGG